MLLHLRDRDGDVALPLLLRPLPDGSGWDAISAYGYGGPVARPEHAAAALGPALDAWARANGVPFVVRWPAKMKPGTSDALMSQMDLLASFAALFLAIPTQIVQLFSADAGVLRVAAHG